VTLKLQKGITSSSATLGAGVVQLKLTGKATSPNPPDTNQNKVCDHAKGGSLFQSGCQGNPSSCGGPCHWSILEKGKAPTNTPPCLQAGNVSNMFPNISKTMNIVHAPTKYRVIGDQFELRPKNRPYYSRNHRKSLSRRAQVSFPLLTPQQHFLLITPFQAFGRKLA
jgi:hypothetical protein